MQHAQCPYLVTNWGGGGVWNTQRSGIKIKTFLHWVGSDTIASSAKQYVLHALLCKYTCTSSYITVNPAKLVNT